MLLPAGSDLPTHDDGRCTAQGEDGHRAQRLDVAGQRLGRQDLRGPLHVPHDHLAEGRSQAPQRLIEDHGTGIEEEFFQDDTARAEQQPHTEGKAPADCGMNEHDDQFQHPGAQGG